MIRSQLDWTQPCYRLQRTSQHYCASTQTMLHNETFLSAVHLETIHHSELYFLVYPKRNLESFPNVF